MSSGPHDFQGVNAAYIEELYERFRRDPHSVDASARALFQTWSPAYAEASARQALNPRTSGTAGNPEEPSGTPFGRRRRQSRPVDSPVRPSRRGDRSARRAAGSAIRRSSPRRTASRKPISARCRRVSITGPVAAGATTMWDVVDAAARDLLRHDGLRLRAHLRSGRAALAARGRRDRPVPRAGRSDRSGGAARSADRRRSVRAFPPPHVSRQDAVLDRGPRHARADPRRSDQRSRRGRSASGVHRHGASRPAERDGARARQAVRADSRGVQGSGSSRARGREGVQWSGDVKYHLGASRAIDGRRRSRLVVSMPPNPSHLEAIDPVLEGMARAAGTDASRPGAPVFDPDAVLPILIHGDAAFPGQGVVAETLNLHRLDGLLDRRHDPHHREQPDRLHDRRPTTRTARSTRAAWRAGSRFRSSTSTRTTRRRASPPRGSRSRTARRSSATS